MHLEHAGAAIKTFSGTIHDSMGTLPAFTKQPDRDMQQCAEEHFLLTSRDVHSHKF
jgi:hypothetical protein